MFKMFTYIYECSITSGFEGHTLTIVGVDEDRVRNHARKHFREQFGAHVDGLPINLKQIGCALVADKHVMENAALNVPPKLTSEALQAALDADERKLQQQAKELQRTAPPPFIERLPDPYGRCEQCRWPRLDDRVCPNKCFGETPALDQETGPQPPMFEIHAEFIGATSLARETRLFTKSAASLKDACDQLRKEANETPSTFARPNTMNVITAKQV